MHNDDNNDNINNKTIKTITRYNECSTAAPAAFLASAGSMHGLQQSNLPSPYVTTLALMKPVTIIKELRKQCLSFQLFIQHI